MKFHKIIKLFGSEYWHCPEVNGLTSSWTMYPPCRQRSPSPKCLNNICYSTNFLFSHYKNTLTLHIMWRLPVWQSFPICSRPCYLLIDLLSLLSPSMLLPLPGPLGMLLENPLCEGVEEDLRGRQNSAAGSSLFKLFKSKWKTIHSPGLEWPNWQLTMSYLNIGILNAVVPMEQGMIRTKMKKGAPRDSTSGWGLPT